MMRFKVGCMRRDVLGRATWIHEDDSTEAVGGL